MPTSDPEMSASRSKLKCPDCIEAPIKKRPRYGFFKWLMLMGGGTPTPDSTEYYCERCNRTLAVTSP
jgi:hypothetical protein